MDKPHDSLSAVLVDVGGTLLPEGSVEWSQAKMNEARTVRLQEAMPSFSHALCAELVGQLQARAAQTESTLAQDTNALIRETIQHLGLYIDVQGITAIRRAMNLPLLGRIEPFDGARELLAAVKVLNLRCVVVTNATWRDIEDNWRDFEDLGVSGYVDAIISSVDVGYRKPHPAIFKAALDAVGCGVQHCVMIGNSELNDVQPAVSLGMRAIRVAIEEPQPEVSDAHAVVTSLAEAAAVLRTWV